MAIALIFAIALMTGEVPSTEQQAVESVLRAHEQAMTLPDDELRVIQSIQDRPAQADHTAIAQDIQAVTTQRVQDRVSEVVVALGGTEEQGQALAKSFGNGRERHPDEQPTPDGQRLVIFVSQSMPDAELADIATTMPDNAVMVLRGFLEGQDLAMLAKRIKGWSDDPADLGSVQLDPRPFQELGVDRAPAIALQQDGQWQGIVFGTAQPSYLLEQVDTGRRGDLGQVGPTLDVIEEDLLARMEAEMPARIRARAQSGYERFLSTVDMHDLSEAQLYRERLIDPSVRVAQDFTLPDGTVIARQGDRVNPFANRPFMTRLIIADMRVPWQKAFARRVAKQSLGRHRVMVLASNLDAPEGWKDYHALATELDQHLFLLTDEIVARFAIDALPAVVDGAGDKIRVRVFPRDSAVDDFNIDTYMEGG